jgi:hypothetical protein
MEQSSQRILHLF